MHFRALLSTGGVVVIAAGTLFACAVGGPGPGGETVSALIGDAGIASPVGAVVEAGKMTVDSSSSEVVDTGSSVMVPEESGSPEADTVEDSGDQTEAASPPPSSEGGSCNLSQCAACTVMVLGTLTTACCTAAGVCGCGAAGICLSALP